MAERSLGTPPYGGAAAAASSGIDTMNEAIGEISEKAGSKLESARETVADKLRGAADGVRDRSGRLPGGDRVAGAAQSAADALASSANYVRSHSAREMGEDLLGLVKQNPTTSLLVAGAAGFLIAWALRRD